LNVTNGIILKCITLRWIDGIMNIRAGLANSVMSVSVAVGGSVTSVTERPGDSVMIVKV
jgi:hypothetical protein